LVRSIKGDSATELEMQSCIQRLAQFLTGWEATSFLIGEYDPVEMRDNPVFTIGDGLFWLSQVAEGNSVVRKLQIIKLRGTPSMPGLHTIRISRAGLQMFPRTLTLGENRINPVRRRRLSMGIAELDRMMGGGILEGDSILVAGPSGVGKTVLAAAFIAEGLRRGEPGILAVFEERPGVYLDRAGSFGMNLRRPHENGKLEVLYDRPVDLSVDETMQELVDAIERVGAKRLVIDSLVGFEMVLAPGYRQDFRNAVYRLIRALTGAGLTVLSTVEVEDNFTAVPLSHHTISFLTDDIIRMRYVEIEGQMRRVLFIAKMRRSDHSKDIREYVITGKDVIVIKPRSADFQGLTTGIPTRIGSRPTPAEEREPKAKK
jgi:circadian clock protein KaiC